MNEVARQCRVKADAYENFQDDTYLRPLLMSAADSIEILEEKVRILKLSASSKTVCADELADVKFQMIEIRRRLNNLELLSDETKDKDF